MDLQKILDGIIAKYGKNEGYAIPEIVWAEGNMFSRYGEYQYWINRIIVSRFLDTDEISEEAKEMVIFHEYTHQLYNHHNAAFYKRMRAFGDYKKYEKEIEDYFQKITGVPSAPPHNLQLDENEEVVFCYLPFDADDRDSYWRQFYYINHCIVGYLPNRITKEYTDRNLKQVVWLVNNGDADYIAGWCKDARIYAKKKILDCSQIGRGLFDYKLSYPVSSGKVLLPECVQFALSEEERPEKLVKSGVCSGIDMEPDVFHEIIRDINVYPLDFVDLGISEDSIDCVPGLEITDIEKLIEMSKEDDKWGNHAVWIMNKAVDVEKSYRTYFRRAEVFTEILMFDRAILDLEQALKCAKEEAGCDYDEAWIKSTIKELKAVEKEFG